MKKHAEKHWHLIEKQSLLKEIFREPPLISYKRGRSLKDTLARSKLANTRARESCRPVNLFLSLSVHFSRVFFARCSLRRCPILRAFPHYLNAWNRQTDSIRFPAHPAAVCPQASFTRRQTKTRACMGLSESPLPRSPPPFQSSLLASQPRIYGLRRLTFKTEAARQSSGTNIAPEHKQNDFLSRQKHFPVKCPPHSFKKTKQSKTKKTNESQDFG